jgi:hypothetical protein
MILNSSQHVSPLLPLVANASFTNHQVSSRISLSICIIFRLIHSSSTSIRFLWFITSDSFTIFGQIQFQRFHIFIKAKCGHGPQQIIAIDRFTFLLQTFITGFRRNEGNKLRDTFLDCFFGILCNFCIFRQRIFHNPSNVGNRKVSILKSYVCGTRGCNTVQIQSKILSDESNNYNANSQPNHNKLVQRWIIVEYNTWTLTCSRISS